MRSETSNLSHVAPFGATELGQVNLIAVVAYGSSFDLYVNRQELITVSDSAYSSGQIGVIAEDINNPTEVAFSNAEDWSR